MKSCVAAGVALVGASLLLSCGADALEPGARVAVSVAPLQLTGVTNARYRLDVHNGDDALVMTRELTSLAYGGGDGSLSYVAPCDADPAVADNTVSITLLELYGGAGGSAVIAPASYQNPGTVSREVDCVADADTPVTFDITIARRADQGFFDVAVSFTDIYCSAKLDCRDQDGDPIALLFDDDGDRGTTIVTALACTGGVSGGDTVLYRDDVVLDCGAAGSATVSPDGAGNLDYGSGISGDAVLFGAAVTRGDEQLGYTKRYWNVMLGLVDGTPSCRLTTRATASKGAFDPEGTTPAGTTYPFIHWDVAITDGSGALVCDHHPVDGVDDEAGVATEYTSADAPRTFASAWSGAASIPVDPPGSAPACEDWDYCWLYEDGSGGTATDDGIEGADATVVGPTWTTGHSGGGLAFNGTTDYLTATDTVFTTSYDGVTGVAWLDWGGDNGDDWAVVVSATQAWEFGIRSSDDTLWFYEIGRGYVVGCPFPASTHVGTWTQVGFTVSSSAGRARVYIDGALCNEVGYSGAIATSTGEIQHGVWLGGQANEQEHLKGTLDGLRVAARELGEADFAALYAAETGGTPATAPTLTSCKALFDAGYGVDGVYTIDPDGAGTLAERDVYCDMANGGWTLAGQQAADATTYLGGQARNTPGDAEFSSDLTGVPFTDVMVFNTSNGESFVQSFSAQTWVGVTSGQQQVGASAPAYRQGTYGGTTVMGCVNYSYSDMSGPWACDNDSGKGQMGHIADYAGEYCSGGRLDTTWAWTDGDTCSLRGVAYIWGIAIR